MPLAELNRKLADEDKTFVWLKRQVDDRWRKQIAELNLKGVYQRKEYKRKYPEGEAAAHVVGFTNVEDKGQEGVELAFNKRTGRPRRLAPRHQGPLGRVVEDVGDTVPAGGRPRPAAVDRQQGAVLRLPEAARRGAPRTRPAPAAWWCSTPSPARCWRWPTTRATCRTARRT
jgi:hypothetical protein